MSAFAESCLPQLYDALVPFNIVTEPVITLDIFQTGVKFIRWQEWFTETSQTITITGQIHGHLHYSSTSRHPAPFPA